MKCDLRSRPLKKKKPPIINMTLFCTITLFILVSASFWDFHSIFFSTEITSTGWEIECNN